jgi:hypothetical protein
MDDILRAMLARLGVVVLAAALAEPGAAPKPVGPGAVWSPPAGFVASVHAACDGTTGDDFGPCFVERMKAAGASPAALDFARRTGNLGYLRRFRDDPLVGVAWAEFPYGANENSVCFLVNGLPPMIDVDDLSLLGPAALGANAEWVALANARPKLAIFPGDRFGEGAVVAAPRPGGGVRFAVEYALVDGCHACARLGVLRLGFDFDGEGKYVGVAVLAVLPNAR